MGGMKRTLSKVPTTPAPTGSTEALSTVPVAGNFEEGGVGVIASSSTSHQTPPESSPIPDAAEVGEREGTGASSFAMEPAGSGAELPDLGTVEESCANSSGTTLRTDSSTAAPFSSLTAIGLDYGWESDDESASDPLSSSAPVVPGPGEDKEVATTGNAKKRKAKTGNGKKRKASTGGAKSKKKASTGGAKAKPKRKTTVADPSTPITTPPRRSNRKKKQPNDVSLEDPTEPQDTLTSASSTGNVENTKRVRFADEVSESGGTVTANTSDSMESLNLNSSSPAVKNDEFVFAVPAPKTGKKQMAKTASTEEPKTITESAKKPKTTTGRGKKPKATTGRGKKPKTTTGRGRKPRASVGGAKSKKKASTPAPQRFSGRKRKRVEADIVPELPKVKKRKLLLPKGPQTYLRSNGMIADWDEYLSDLEGVRWVCPVNFFAHAPFAESWQTFAKIGTKIELPHPQMVGQRPVNCIATIVAFAGYKALVQFQKMGTGPDQFAWISYCGSSPKPLTYSTQNGILILPVEGAALANLNTNFETLGKEFWDKFIQEAEQPPISIGWDHESSIRAELDRHQQKFKLKRIVELIDAQDTSRNRCGIVISITGDRLLVRYPPDADLPAGRDAIDVDISMKSDLVHPLGWSYTVGIPLKNFPSKEYRLPRIKKELFPTCPRDISIRKGMVFEFIHPFRPHQIVAGYVFKIFRLGYFVACVNTNVKEDTTKFPFHVTSDYILPVGFCAEHNIPLEVPCGEASETFSWKEYCAKTNAIPLDLACFPKKPRHRFVKECKLEMAASMFLPPHFGPGTVTNIAEHLLLIHFDGWPRDKPEYSQWVSAVSTDIYPVGWAEMVGHYFQSHAEPHSRPDTYYIGIKKEEETKGMI